MTKVETWLIAGTIIFLTAGAVLFGTSVLSAGGPGQAKPQFPPLRGKLPRLDESQARPLSAARGDLKANTSLAAVIEAAETGDVDRLLSLAVSAGDDYCSQGKQLPEECKSREDKVATVYQDSGEIGPRPVETMRRWLMNLYDGNGATLEFASRDSRKGEGDGGQYYLFFRVAKASRFDGVGVADAFGVVVIPGPAKVIQWFGFAGPDANGLKWAQVAGGEDGAKYQILITPESVKDWPDIEGNKGD